MQELNLGQQEAADGFFKFLFSADPEAIISGPGGVGKTYLMSHMIDKIMPAYFDTCKIMNIPPEFDDVIMTATTNKAAEVLAVATGRPTSTIHSFMNLKVQDDYTNGTTKISPTNQWMVHEKKIIFIDECSMIDSQLLSFIRKGTHKCKIIYVGDHCQLAPVMEKISPIYKDEKPFWVLTEQMRNNGQPALMAVCDQLRHTVETGEFNPIKIVPGVIDLLDDDQMATVLEEYFVNQTLSTRIGAYTNARVEAYNNHIRALRGLPYEFTVGENLINNSAIHIKDRMLTVEEELTVEWISEKTQFVPLDEGVSLEIRPMNFLSRIGYLIENIPVPVNKQHHKELMAYFAKKKNWPIYFKLKNYYPDLRPRDAATIHKLQGSTYDTVFIDLNDISSCRQPDQAARLLYVAFSRPRSRIYLYGNLAAKFGGLTH